MARTHQAMGILTAGLLTMGGGLAGCETDPGARQMHQDPPPTQEPAPGQPGRPAQPGTQPGPADPPPEQY